MFPLILLALGLGAVAAYGLSPKAKGWVDEHVKAIEDALVAHKIADAHLKAVARAPIRGTAHDIDDILLDVHTASVATKVAAQNTVLAAKTARTEQERQAVAKSAAAVIARQEKIAIMLQQLGVGQCGVRPYQKVSARIKDALIARLKGAGMSVTGSGSNQWDVDPHESWPADDVKLRAFWDQSTETLYLIVTSGKGLLATCDKIWGRIEPILKEMGIVVAA